eukprot:g1416.t1
MGCCNSHDDGAGIAAPLLGASPNADDSGHSKRVERAESALKAGGRVLEGETPAQRDARGAAQLADALSGGASGDAVAAAEAVLVTFFDVAQAMPVLGKALKALRAVHRTWKGMRQRGAAADALLLLCKQIAETLGPLVRDARAPLPAEALEALGAALARAEALAARYAREGGAVRVARGAQGDQDFKQVEQAVYNALNMFTFKQQARMEERIQVLENQRRGEGWQHNLPYERNLAFEGRAEQLAAAAHALGFAGAADASTDGAAAAQQQRQRLAGAAIVALRALGGLGKTQVALELAYRLLAAGRVDRVVWVDAAAARIKDSFAEAGERVLGLPPPDKNATVDERCAAVRDGLMRLADRMFLVVLDNVDDARSFRKLLPKTGQCRVLVTTRLRGALRNVHALELGALPDGDAMRVLLKGVEGGEAALGDAERGAARRLMEQLGKLTLALDVASRLLECEPPSRLLRRLEAEGAVDVMEGAEDEGADDQVFDKPTSLRVLFGASAAQLDGAKPADALALEVAGALAFLAPAPPVPLGLLRRCVGGGGDNGGAEAGAGAAEALLRRALHRLSTLGLVRLEPGTREPSAHRLVLAYWRHRGGGAPPAALLRRVEAALGEMEEERAAEHGTWGADRAAVVHARAAAARPRSGAGGGGGGGDGGVVGALWAAVGSMALYKLGQAGDAKEAYESALAIEEAAYGPEHTEVATTLTNLGNAYGALGDPAKQKELLERALAIEEAAYGPEHTEVA